MQSTDTIIIGGGQAGLAMSHSLSGRGVENVVLERGRIGERWQSERWDSLRLLTPRWQARLPGWSYRGPDQDGYMSRTEFVAYLEDYARSFSPNLETGVTVTRVSAVDGGYQVDTDAHPWRARNVVVATGDCDRPAVPAFARAMPAGLLQVVPAQYRNPSDLPHGGVLVVGGSATGVQLAAEIHASGRPVALSVGRHTRLPRSYRGADILWWLDRMGVFDERAHEVADLDASRTQPSLQLVGSQDRRTLDLTALAAAGIRLLGRAHGSDGRSIRFADDLIEHTVAADAKLSLLLHRIDTFAEVTGLAEQVGEPDPPRPVPMLDTPTLLDPRAEGIRTVLWATGFRRAYPWLDVPVLDDQGEIIHDGGITSAPGLYVIGLRFLRRRKSSFIDGVADDAEELTEHLTAARRMPRRAVA